MEFRRVPALHLDGEQGQFNTANGVLNKTTGNSNTALGNQALFSNTTGGSNTAVGRQALQSNTEANQNTAFGYGALSSNTVGNQNTAFGGNALFNGIGGSFNTAVGFSAMPSDVGGSSNTAVGHSALLQVTSGFANTALGVNAGSSVTTADHVIAIGSPAANASNSCYIGNIYSNVQPIVGTDPDSVTITSSGRLGRGNVSSRRYKHDIKPIDKAGKALYSLQSVSFRYHHKEYDTTQTLAFGLIAEEVAEVAPDLVGRNPAGQPESVRYDQVNAMLLNEFLKEHRKVEELESTVATKLAMMAYLKSTVAQQQQKIQALAATVKEQTTQIQKVSAKLEMSMAARRTVLNDQ